VTLENVADCEPRYPLSEGIAMSDDDLPEVIALELAMFSLEIRLDEAGRAPRPGLP